MCFFQLLFCVNCPLPTPSCLKWVLISSTVLATVTFHPFPVAANPQLHRCIFRMCVVVMSQSFLIACFTVSHPLSTAWGTGNRPPMDSQVGAPVVWVFHFSTSLGYRHPLLSLDSNSGLWFMHLGTPRCNHNHSSGVVAWCSSVGELAMSDSFISSFV